MLRNSYPADKNVGPCASSIDETLCNLGVERQAYYGRSFIGNHCHKMLKVYIYITIFFKF